MDKQKLFFCPRCNAIYVLTPPVISRKDGHTKICSYCGLIEGLEDTGMKAPYHGPQYWTVDHRTDNERARPEEKSAPIPPSPSPTPPTTDAPATAAG